MRPYEVMVIFDASLEEDAVRALVDRFTKQLTAAGAKSVKADIWGKRRLAYPVRHRNEGYYVVMEANAEPAALSDLDRQLTLADEVTQAQGAEAPRTCRWPISPGGTPRTRPPQWARTRKKHEDGTRQHGKHRRQPHPGARAALHSQRSGDGDLRHRRQPDLDGPPEPGKARIDLVLRRGLLGQRWPKTRPPR